ncbi:MAG TPA: hypothetical protein VFF73_04385 [Planctomycetota bacterium]|nr:hypothetical protein [Planctomycetota bacterium]
MDTRRKAVVGLVVVLPLGALALLARSEAQSPSAPTPTAATSTAPAPTKTPTPTLQPGAVRPAASAAAPRPLEPRKGADLVSALRTADTDAAREAYLRSLGDRAQLKDASLRDALLGLAADPSSTPQARAVALDLIRRAPLLDAASVAKLGAIAAASDLDADTRTRAIDVLHQLSTRDDLDAAVGRALLAAIASPPSADARAFALDALRTSASSDAELASVGGFLADGSPLVRASAARALATSPASARTTVAGQLEGALASENDQNAAGAMIESLLRVGRAGADALLAQAAQEQVVQQNAGLQRQVADYRAQLAAGETDPTRIQNEHARREQALAAQR